MDSLRDPEHALVVLSGGQDSTTCLYWALSRFAQVSAISFDYGQRHRVELDAARTIAAMAGVGHTIIPINTFSALGGNALTDQQMSPDTGPDAETLLPNTFVPGRNLIFILHAAAWAYAKNIRHIVLGVCQSDYSGYPDCRDDSIKAMQVAVNSGMDAQYTLHTPLMWRSKKDAWMLARELGGDALVNLIVEESHTCYMGQRGQREPWGYGCGTCPACRLRAAGYAAYAQALADLGQNCPKG